jgi:hypothetical protein
MELGLGQAGSGFHLPLISDVHSHQVASSMAFWSTAYLILYWGTTLFSSSGPIGWRISISLSFLLIPKKAIRAPLYTSTAQAVSGRYWWFLPGNNALS